jgi:hypothetical protein
VQAGGAVEVHERLVDRHRLDQRRELEHDRANVAADAAILLHVRANDAGVRAEPSGFEHRHRRSHAERARDVATGQHHAALAAADDHRLVGERGIVALLDRGVEGVAIHMRDRERVDLAMVQELRRAATGAAPCSVGRVVAAITAEAGHAPPTGLRSPLPQWVDQGVSRVCPAHSLERLIQIMSRGKGLAYQRCQGSREVLNGDG